MTDRIDILQRILNLRAKAEGGATEAEAMACIEKADKLMHSYRVEEAELALAESSGQIKIDIVTRKSASLASGNGGSIRRGNRHSASVCTGAIADYTGCRAVMYQGGRQAEFLGDRPDAELAVFLQDMIRESMDRAYNAWRREYGAATGYGAKKSFQLSMAVRINARLRDMKAEKDAEATKQRKEAAKQLEVDESVLESMVTEQAIPELTSTALVLVVAEAAREQAIEESFKQTYPSLGKLGGISGGCGHGSAAAAGRAAGNKVHLGRTIGQSSNTKIAC